MAFFKRAWRGEEPLWKVFWILGVGSLIAVLFAALQGLWLIKHNDQFLGAVLRKTLITGVVAYVVWLSMVLWTSRKNVQKRIWVDLLGMYYTGVIATLGFLGYLIQSANSAEFSYYTSQACECETASCIEPVVYCTFKVDRAPIYKNAHL